MCVFVSVCNRKKFKYTHLRFIFSLKLHLASALSISNFWDKFHYFPFLCVSGACLCLVCLCEKNKLFMFNVHEFMYSFGYKYFWIILKPDNKIWRSIKTTGKNLNTFHFFFSSFLFYRKWIFGKTQIIWNFNIVKKTKKNLAILINTFATVWIGEKSVWDNNYKKSFLR